MSNITLHQLEPDLAQRLEQRAIEHGHSVEAEIKDILQRVLASEAVNQPNLAEAIEKHFAHLGDFDLPEITRESMRAAPNFEPDET
jgi:antitoxin FitA